MKWLLISVRYHHRYKKKERGPNSRIWTERDTSNIDAYMAKSWLKTRYILLQVQYTVSPFLCGLYTKVSLCFTCQNAPLQFFLSTVDTPLPANCPVASVWFPVYAKIFHSFTKSRQSAHHFPSQWYRGHCISLNLFVSSYLSFLQSILSFPWDEVRHDAKLTTQLYLVKNSTPLYTFMAWCLGAGVTLSLLCLPFPGSKYLSNINEIDKSEQKSSPDATGKGIPYEWPQNDSGCKYHAP